uniref:S100 calcium binding protein A13 n=2 Tax=Podarcis muralis TaxID=64176 RepID=A0A670JYH6_PODMU
MELDWPGLAYGAPSYTVRCYKHTPHPSSHSLSEEGRNSPLLSPEMASSEWTELEAAIEKIVNIFFTHAGREGKKGTLTAGEFKELVHEQLPNLMKDVGDLDEKMKSLDVNNDEELKFGEYWRLIGELAKDIKREKVGRKK